MSNTRKSFTSQSNEIIVEGVENKKNIQRRNCEECKSHEEYIGVLKNALKEVLDQNDY